MAALGNGGKVYNLTIVDSITSPEGDIVSQRTPSLMHDFGEDSPNTAEYLSYILQGMEGVVDESGTAARYFRRWQYRAGRLRQNRNRRRSPRWIWKTTPGS